MLDFPNTPALNQTYTGPNGVIWTWDGAKWANGSTIATAYAPLASPVFTGDPQAPTPPAGDADTSLATTAFVAAATATALHDVGRNLLHNSMFNIAQRGGGRWSTAASYTLDRWQMWFTGGVFSLGSASLSDVNRSDIGDESAQYAMNISLTGTGGAGDYAQMVQPVENVRRLAGKTITVSFYANSDTANIKVGVSILQYFGTGGSPSASVGVNGQTVTLSSVVGKFARYSVTLAIPSIAGKTLGTNGNDYTSVTFWLSAGANNSAASGSVGVQSGTINLWGVQLEIGPTATPLEKLDPVTQLQQCQRFYQIGTWQFGGASSAAGAGQTFTLSFPVVMRATPNVTPTFTTQVNCGSSRLDQLGNYACCPYTINTAAGGWGFNGTFTASADL